MLGGLLWVHDKQPAVLNCRFHAPSLPVGCQVKWLYQKHCGELRGGPEEDGDVEREAARQREYLEKTVDRWGRHGGEGDRGRRGRGSGPKSRA